MAASCITYQITNISEVETSVSFSDCDGNNQSVVLLGGESFMQCCSISPKLNENLEIVALDSCDPCYICPEGTVLEGDECVSVEIIGANYTGNTFPVVAGDKNIAYSKFGVRLYPDISALTLPLYAYGTNASYALYQNDGIGAVVAPIAGVQSNLWGCDGVSNPTCGTYATGGRLNKVGVWATGYPDNTELPFTFCVDLENTKQYLIGIGGDNKIKIYIDNILHVFLDATDTLHGTNNSSVTRPFIHWHVFPITLPAGNHTIKVVGLNIDATRSFGAELYDIDLPIFQATLLNPAVATPNCGNVEVDLTPYIVFSTGAYVGMNIPDPNDPLGTWNCPDGYTLDECTGVPTCTLVTKVGATPCCYKLTSCDDPLTVFYTQDNLTAYVGQTISLGNNVCYYVTLNESEECINPISDLVVLGSFESCVQCAPFYTLKDCLTGEVLTLNGDPLYFRIFNLTGPVPTPNNFIGHQILSLETPAGVWAGCGYFELLPEDPGAYTEWEDVITLSERIYPVDQVYELTNCVSGEIFYANNSELATVADTTKAILIEGSTACWTVKTIDDCCYVLEPAVLVECFTDCDECLALFPCICTILTNTDSGPISYRYIDCDNIQRSIVVPTGASTPKMCVKQWLSGGLRFIQEFGECVDGECPLPVITNRHVQPGWDTGHCDPEHVEEVSCQYARMMHDKMLAEKYKIETCCAEDELSTTVDFELLKLELITHPDICKTIIQLGCLCLSANDNVNPIQYITVCADPTNTFYISPLGDVIIRFAPQRCRWEMFQVVGQVETLYQTFGSDGTPPIGIWTKVDPPLDGFTITSTSGSCV